MFSGALRVAALDRVMSGFNGQLRDMVVDDDHGCRRQQLGRLVCVQAEASSVLHRRVDGMIRIQQSRCTQAQLGTSISNPVQIELEA